MRIEARSSVSGSPMGAPGLDHQRRNASAGRLVVLGVALALLGAPCALQADTDSLWWADSDGIKRAALDATGLQLMVPGVDADGFDIDPGAGKIYWTEAGSPNRIRRANLDGSAIENLYTTTVRHPFAVVLDPAGGKLYFTNTGYQPDIQRMNLDGSGRESIVALGSSDRATHIGLDGHGRVYWLNATTETIDRANLDGSAVANVTGDVDDFYDPGFAVDPAGGFVYWVNSDARIVRANLDGSNPVTMTGLPAASGLCGTVTGCSVPGFAVGAGFIYVGEGEGPIDEIRRMPIGGSTFATLVQVSRAEVLRIVRGSTIFADSFESGDAGSWSNTAP